MLRFLATSRWRAPWVTTAACARCPLSKTARAARILRRLLDDSGLTVRELAAAIGVAPRTIDSHLTGRRPISQQRLTWYHQVVSVQQVDADHVQLLVRVHIRRRRWGFRKRVLQKTETAPKDGGRERAQKTV
jgi:DNA-binding transcriptional ArsR family regulator